MGKCFLLVFLLRDHNSFFLDWPEINGFHFWVRKPKTLHPPEQTWNLKMGAPWNLGDSGLGNHHFQVPAVNFGGCPSYVELFHPIETLVFGAPISEDGDLSTPPGFHCPLCG